MNNLSSNRPDDIRHLKIRSFLCCAKIIMLMILFCFCFVIVLARKYKKIHKSNFVTQLHVAPHMLDVVLVSGSRVFAECIRMQQLCLVVQLQCLTDSGWKSSIFRLLLKHLFIIVYVLCIVLFMLNYLNDNTTF